MNLTSDRPQIASWRVIGPHGEGPWEVQAETGMGAVQKAFALSPELRDTYQGIDEPRGPHGPVVAYRRVSQGGPVAMAVDGKFDVAFLCWETVLSVAEAAEHMGRDPSRVRVLIRENRLSAYQESTSRGPVYWLTASAVDAFEPMAAGRPKGTPK